MGYVVGFVDTEGLSERVSACPLALSSSEDYSRCQTCPYNQAFPGEPILGCSIRIDADDWTFAMERLKERDAALADSFNQAVETPAIHPESDPERLKKLNYICERWANLAENDFEPHEELICSAVARFSKAALELSFPVVMVD